MRGIFGAVDANIQLKMKKYKIYFSLTNLFGQTQAEVVKLQTYLKGIMATGAITTWLSVNAEIAIYVGIGGVIADTLLACLYFEEIKGSNS